MSIHIETDTMDYGVVADAMITIQVTIGDAQAGGWIVGWDSDHVVAKGSEPRAVQVGLGSSVRGRTLQVVATAIDVRPETNRLSSTLVISGGAAGTEQVVSAWDEGNDGDIAVFTTLIGFQ
jgi:hypothetical protein